MGTPYAEAIRHWESYAWSPAPSLPEVSLPDLAAQASRVFWGDQNFSGNLILHDNVLVKGGAVVTGAISLRGLLVVEGDLTVTGDAAYTCGGPVGIVALGSVHIRGKSRLMREGPGSGDTAFPAIVSLRGDISVAGSAEIGGSLYAMGTGDRGVVTLQGNIRLQGGAFGRRVLPQGDVVLSHIWETDADAV